MQVMCERLLASAREARQQDTLLLEQRGDKTKQYDLAIEFCRAKIDKSQEAYQTISARYTTAFSDFREFADRMVAETMRAEAYTHTDERDEETIHSSTQAIEKLHECMRQTSKTFCATMSEKTKEAALLRAACQNHATAVNEREKHEKMCLSAMQDSRHAQECGSKTYRQTWCAMYTKTPSNSRSN